MFTSISWPQYLQAIAILTSAYYAAVIILYFRVELFAILHRIKNGKPFHETHFAKKEVLGTIAEDQNQRSFNAEELEFSSREPNQLIDETH
jgi:hypothetical protein